jgi:hypothetical protein
MTGGLLASRFPNEAKVERHDTERLIVFTVVAFLTLDKWG